jgi:hypothetical protein
MGTMFRFKLNQSFTIWFFVSLGLFLITSCGEISSVTPIPKPSCLPTTGGGFYDFPPSNVQVGVAETITNQIFDLRYSNIQLARHEALRFLKIETRRWSHFRDEGENNAQVRMIITFITPELVQAAILNYVLSDPNFQTISLGNYKEESFNNLKKRNEFVFLLTFLPATDQGDNIFSVPPERIRLHNTSKLDVPSTHSDDFLNGTLKYSEKNQSGYIFFPLGINESGKENDCSRVLDPERDTSLMLNITNATIGTRANQTISWPIPFTSLLLTESIPFQIDYMAVVQPGEEVMFTPLSSKNLPRPNFGNNPDDNFWQEYGRFIWGKLTSTFE